MSWFTSHSSQRSHADDQALVAGREVNRCLKVGDPHAAEAAAAELQKLLNNATSLSVPVLNELRSELRLAADLATAGQAWCENLLLIATIDNGAAYQPRRMGA